VSHEQAVMSIRGSDTLPIMHVAFY